MPNPSSFEIEPHKGAAHIEEVLREVNRLAATAIQLSRLPCRPEEEEDDLQSRISMLQAFIDRMGWVADVGLRQLGERGAFDRAEDWMLPAL